MKSPIILDFDGTLADTYAFIFKIEQELSEEYDIPKLHYSEDKRDQRLTEMLKGNVPLPRWKLPGFLKKAKQRFTEDMSRNVSLFPGTSHVLDALKKEHELFIISSNFAKHPIHHIRMVLRRNAVVGHIKGIYTVPLLRGKRQAFQKLCKEQGYSLDEIIYVADEISDVEVCAALGISFIGVSWGYNSEKALREAGAEHIAHNHEELLQLIKEMT